MPGHLIHADAHPGNMLFERGELTGILDFDLSGFGNRIYDPCYCAASILASGFQRPEHRTQWRAIFRNLMEGYAEIITVSPVEWHAVFQILVSIQLLFMAHFLESDKPAAAQCKQEVLCWLREQRELIADWTE